MKEFSVKPKNKEQSRPAAIMVLQRQSIGGCQRVVPGVPSPLPEHLFQSKFADNILIILMRVGTAEGKMAEMAKHTSNEVHSAGAREWCS